MQPRVYISIAFVVAIAFSLLQFAEAVEAATPSGNAVLAFYYLYVCLSLINRPKSCSFMQICRISSIINFILFAAVGGMALPN